MAPKFVRSCGLWYLRLSDLRLAQICLFWQKINLQHSSSYLFYLTKNVKKEKNIAASFGHFLVCSNGLSSKPRSFKKDFSLHFQTRAATVTGAVTQCVNWTPQRSHLSQRAKDLYGRVEYLILLGNMRNSAIVKLETKI